MITLQLVSLSSLFLALLAGSTVEEDDDKYSGANRDEYNGDHDESSPWSCSTISENKGHLFKGLHDANDILTRWPHGIVPYVIERVNSRVRRAVMRAIEDYHKHTCIRFRPHTGEKDYLAVWPGDSSSCYGMSTGIGMVGGRQIVFLSEKAGCPPHDMVLHELMHAIGFRHEHARVDRGPWLKFNTQNMQDTRCYTESPEGKLSMDPLTEPTIMGEQYDYCSVMHYHGTSCSKNGKPTMEAKKNNPCKPLGSAKEFSEIDIRRINKFYKEECAARDLGSPSPGAGACRDDSEYCSGMLDESRGGSQNCALLAVAKVCQRSCQRCNENFDPPADCTNERSENYCDFGDDGTTAWNCARIDVPFRSVCKRSCGNCGSARRTPEPRPATERPGGGGGGGGSQSCSDQSIMCLTMMQPDMGGMDNCKILSVAKVCARSCSKCGQSFRPPSSCRNTANDDFCDLGNAETTAWNCVRKEARFYKLCKRTCGIC